MPRATGIFTFVAMLPLLLAGQLGTYLAITEWMLCFAVLGWTVSDRRRAS